jgi:hypothetical protein
LPSLHWTRAASASECIDPRALAVRVEALTGPVLVAPGQAEVSIEGNIEANADHDGFRVRLSVTDPRGYPSGERILDFPEPACRLLDGALALVIATLIDPALGARGLPDELLALGDDERAPEAQLLAELEQQPAAPRASRTPTAPQPSAAASARASERDTPSHFEVGAGAMLGHGPTGEPAAGALASATWFASPAFGLRVEADARFELGAYRLDERRSSRAYAIGAAILACTRVSLIAPLSIPGCIGPDLALAYARGEGFSSDHTARLVSAGARASVGLELELAPAWALDLLAFLRVGPEKRFVYARTDTDYAAARLQRVSLNARLELRHAF